jgi:NOL1/NOP2/fmu family ribosome biogenesis protein
MRTNNFLNSREYKEIARKINDQWNADFAFEDFVIRTQKDKIYIISRDLENIDFKNLNVEQFGMYFAHINERNEIRLSVEGSQIIGPKAKKNVVDIGKLSKLWMSGQDIPFETDCTGMVIVKNEDDYLGCGKVTMKEVIVYNEDGSSKKEMQKTILNFVPKTRRHVKD